MSRIGRLTVLVGAALSLLGTLSSPVSAVTWHNTGSRAYTASGHSGTFSATGVSMPCTGATATGTAPSSAVIGNTYTAMTGSATFTGCSLAGSPAAVSCGYSLTLSNVAVGDTFAGSADTRCNVSINGAEVCKLEGAAAATYTNPNDVLVDDPGKLTFVHSNDLRTTNGTSGTCPLGPNDPVTLTQQAWTITSGTGDPMALNLGPTVVRTP